VYAKQNQKHTPVKFSNNLLQMQRTWQELNPLNDVNCAGAK